jgi:hypothetical protein
VADGVQEVGLAESRVAVDEERVVGLRRRLGHGDSCGMSEPVGSADDEVVEVVLRVQPGVGAATRVGRVDRRRNQLRFDVGRLLADARILFERVVLDVGVHDDREVDDLLVFAQPRDGIEQGKTDALLEHPAGQLVRYL